MGLLLRKQQCHIYTDIHMLAGDKSMSHRAHGHTYTQIHIIHTHTFRDFPSFDSEGLMLTRQTPYWLYLQPQISHF